MASSDDSSMGSDGNPARVQNLKTALLAIGPRVSVTIPTYTGTACPAVTVFDTNMLVAEGYYMQPVVASGARVNEPPRMEILRGNDSLRLARRPDGAMQDPDLCVWQGTTGMTAALMSMKPANTLRKWRRFFTAQALSLTDGAVTASKRDQEIDLRNEHSRVIAAHVLLDLAEADCIYKALNDLLCIMATDSGDEFIQTYADQGDRSAIERIIRLLDMLEHQIKQDEEGVPL